MSVTGICFDFSVVLVGPPRSGKTRFAQAWSGTKPPDSAVDYVPSAFTDMYHLDIDVRDCVEASRHRVHVLDTPGAPDRHGLYRSVLAQRSVSAVNLCVFFANGDEVMIDEMLAWTIAACEASTAERGQPIDLLVVDLCPSRDGRLVNPTTPVVVLDAYDEEVIATCVCRVLCDAHARQVKERDLAEERDALAREVSAHGSILPALAPPLSAPPKEALFDVGHVKDFDAHISVVMIGLPGAGRTTFLSAALDNFVVQEYEPTRRPDVGTFHVRFGDSTANVTLHDGPVRRFAEAAQAALVFIDAYSLTPQHDVDAMLDGLQLTHCLLVFIGIKMAHPTSAVQFLSPSDIARIAASRGGMYVTDVDPRENHSHLLTSVVCLVLSAQSRFRERFSREVELMSRRCEPSLSYRILGCVDYNIRNSSAVKGGLVQHDRA